MGTDCYHDFASLAAREREELVWQVVTRPGTSGVAVVAPHGGGIEPGTSELADAIAGADHSHYAFEGLLARGNARLHITSTRFDEPRLSLVGSAADTLVVLHGEAGEEARTDLGGLDEALVAHIEDSLGAAGFSTGTDPHLAGLDPANICNRGRSGRGVQLELSLGLRRRMFRGIDRAGRRFPAPVFHAFVAAVREAIVACERLGRG